MVLQHIHHILSYMQGKHRGIGDHPPMTEMSITSASHLKKVSIANVQVLKLIEWVSEKLTEPGRNETYATSERKRFNAVLGRRVEPRRSKCSILLTHGADMMSSRKKEKEKSVRLARQGGVYLQTPMGLVEMAGVSATCAFDQRNTKRSQVPR